MVENNYNQASIESALQTQWIGRPLVYYPETDSTNTQLLALAETGAAAGTAIIADYQRHGKGRLQRTWNAAPGTSILVSILFRPTWSPKHIGWLSMAAGLAAITAVSRVTGLKTKLKWPNDIVIHRHEVWRKIGGLLLESRIEGDRIDFAVAGIGLNVNMSRDQLPQSEQPVTSLSLSSGKTVSRRTLLVTLFEQLESEYALLMRGKSPHTAWSASLQTIGQSVRIKTERDGDLVEGFAEATDEWGRLILRLSDGKLVRFAAGDVTLRS